VDNSFLAGLEIARRLIRHCDIVTENFGVSAMERMGLELATRTSTEARLSGATTLVLSPPSIVPTLTVMPLSGSFSAKSF
jgi:hypothetical protein